MVAHERWLRCEWEQLDGLEVESSVDTWKRTIIKATKYFKNTANMPEIGDIGENVKGQLVTFEP